MRILYCLPALNNSGGIERVLSLKANYLVRELGYEVYIVTTDHDSSKGVFYTLDDAIVHEDFAIGYNSVCGILNKILLFSKKHKEYRRKLETFIKANKIDICVSVGWKELGFLHKLSNLCKVMCEWHFAQNSSLIYAKNQYTSKALALLVGNIQVARLIRNTRKLNALVVLTKEDEKIWKKTNVNVIQIYNPSPYPTDRFSDLSSKRLISVGRLEYQKGYEYLIEAWKPVYMKHKDWTLDIYGNGSLRDFLTQEIIRHGLVGGVRLQGVTDNISDEYMNSSGFVMSSRYEGFPMVLLEASSFGLPLISFDCVSGPKEIINNGVNGFLVEIYDVVGLSESMERIVSDEQLRKGMGNNAFEAVAPFSVMNIMARWDKLFKSLINE